MERTRTRLFHPQWAMRAFMDFQIPEDMCGGDGYPQLTDQAKRKILGENLLRLQRMDVDETKARLARRAWIGRKDLTSSPL